MENMQETMAMRPEKGRITQEMLPAVAMDQALQAAVAGIHDSQADRTQLLKEPDTLELQLASPPSVHLNSTAELVGLEPGPPSPVLAEVGPQPPRRRPSSDEQGLPWPLGLPMPALSFSM